MVTERENSVQKRQQCYKLLSTSSWSGGSVTSWQFLCLMCGVDGGCQMFVTGVAGVLCVWHSFKSIPEHDRTNKGWYLSLRDATVTTSACRCDNDETWFAGILRIRLSTGKKGGSFTACLTLGHHSGSTRTPRRVLPAPEKASSQWKSSRLRRSETIRVAWLKRRHTSPCEASRLQLDRRWQNPYCTRLWCRHGHDKVTRCLLHSSVRCPRPPARKAWAYCNMCETILCKEALEIFNQVGFDCYLRSVIPLFLFMCILINVFQVLPVGEKVYLRIADDRGWTCSRGCRAGEPLLKEVAGDIVEDKWVSRCTTRTCHVL